MPIATAVVKLEGAIRYGRTCHDYPTPLRESDYTQQSIEAPDSGQTFTIYDLIRETKKHVDRIREGTSSK